MIGNRTVTIVRPTNGGEDRYHDRIDGTPIRIRVHGVKIAPRSSTDLRDGGRNGAIKGLTVFAPIGTDVRDKDLVEVDGRLYEIDGVVGRWGTAGIEIPLVRTAG